MLHKTTGWFPEDVTYLHNKVHTGVMRSILGDGNAITRGLPQQRAAIHRILAAHSNMTLSFTALLIIACFVE
jgi:hypothetical protein